MKQVTSLIHACLAICWDGRLADDRCSRSNAQFTRSSLAARQSGAPAGGFCGRLAGSGRFGLRSCRGLSASFRHRLERLYTDRLAKTCTYRC